MFVNGEAFTSFGAYAKEMDRRQAWAMKWFRIHFDRPHMPSFRVWRKLSKSVKED